jgi:hypothetical protein
MLGSQGRQLRQGFQAVRATERPENMQLNPIFAPAGDRDHSQEQGEKKGAEWHGVRRLDDGFPLQCSSPSAERAGKKWGRAPPKFTQVWFRQETRQLLNRLPESDPRTMKTKTAWPAVVSQGESLLPISICVPA